MGTLLLKCVFWYDPVRRLTLVCYWSACRVLTLVPCRFQAARTTPLRGLRRAPVSVVIFPAP